MKYFVRYFVFALIILINGCGGISMNVIHFSKYVDINKSVSKSNPLKLIKEGEKVPFDYYEIGTIYAEGYPRRSSSYNDSLVLPFLIDAAKWTDADAVIGVHVSKAIPIHKEGGRAAPAIDYASGVLVKYTAEDTDEDAVNDNFVDILPLGNPEGVSLETPFIKDRELVRYLVQQYVERNGYYARLIEGNLILNNMGLRGLAWANNTNDIGSTRVDNLGYTNSKYLLYLWPAYVELKEEEETSKEEDDTTKNVLLNSVLINKKSGEIVWKSDPTTAMWVGENDAQYIYAVIKSYGSIKVRSFRAGHLRTVVEDLYAKFRPNYKALDDLEKKGLW